MHTITRSHMRQRLTFLISVPCWPVCSHRPPPRRPLRNNPVRLSITNRVVYSPHEYGPGVFAQPWFSDPNMSAILADRWQKGLGYIKDEGIAPILIGEFGAKNVRTDTVEGHWINQFTTYLEHRGISWTYWSWNPNSGDTGGILQDG